MGNRCLAGLFKINKIEGFFLICCSFSARGHAFSSQLLTLRFLFKCSCHISLFDCSRSDLCFDCAVAKTPAFLFTLIGKWGLNFFFFFSKYYWSTTFHYSPPRVSVGCYYVKRYKYVMLSQKKNKPQTDFLKLTRKSSQYIK